MTDSCTFCDRANFEKLLVAENKEWYVVATLGQITDGGYVLIIPKEHLSCLGNLSLEGILSFRRIANTVRSALSLSYSHKKTSVASCPVTLFEHGIVGQTIPHAHLHALPVTIDIGKKIHADFPKAEIEEIQYLGYLQEQYQKRQEPYLFWTTPSGSSMVCWNPPAPRQYLRTVAAELLGRPERGDWRSMNPELDQKLIEETIDCLELYFA